MISPISITLRGALCLLALIVSLSMVNRADAQTYTQTFQYDAFGRVISVTYSYAGTTYTVVYTYDDSGNRTCAKTSCP